MGGRPNDDKDNEKTKEAVYAKISGITDSTVSFEPMAETDRAKLYDIPDNFPIQVENLPEGITGKISISALDTALYAQMVGTAEGTSDKAREKLNKGDFVSLYIDSTKIKSENDVYFGRVTGVTSDTITYEKCSAQDIQDSADLYTHVEMSGEDLITPEKKAEIEQTVQAQVEASGFGEEAAYMLLDMATQTDGFQNTAALRSVMVQDAAGNELPAGSVRRLARSARNVGTKFELGDDVELKVELITSGDQLHFKDEGVQLAIGVEAEFEVEAEEGTVHITLSATFVQEVAVDPSIKGSLVYKQILGFIPVPTGVQINSTVDVKSFTAMSIKAEIFTEGPEDESTWETFKKFAANPTELGDIPGLPDGLKEGVKTVGDALKKIDEMQEEAAKKIDALPGYENYIAAIWEQVQNVTNGEINKEDWEELGEKLEKTDITEQLMNLMNLTDETELSTEYYEGLSDLMDRYSELLEKETDWVTLVEEEMFNSHTPAEYGIILGVQGKFLVRADLSLAIGSNLQYEVGKRYNFWFRVGLFKPTSGSSTMDLLDESFAFQFYVMGKIGLKTGVRLKIYTALGSVDAVSVGLTTELGPYLKLWGFFIYDYSKYRGKNTPTWTSKEQMAGALYLEFGLYLMVGVEAKALFLDYDHDFVDEEYPLLSAGDKDYRYGMAYEPLDDKDEIVVYNDGSATLQDGCAVSMVLPEDAYAVKVIDLTSGKQSTQSLDFDNYIFTVSNPNFRVDNVGGKPVVSVISIPDGVRLMQCDLTITFKHGKLAFSSFDMTTTVHLAWTNLTPEEYQQVYTASVTVPDGNGGQEVIWSKRVRKGQLFDLPTDEQIKTLLSWSDAKYVAGNGYGSQQTTDVTLTENTQYTYDLGYQTYQVTVTGIEPDGSSQIFTGKYGEPFDFSALKKTGTNGGGKYTRFSGLMLSDGTTLALNQPITGKFAATNNATATAQYADETVTATFEFDGYEHEAIEVKLRKGGTPDTTAVYDALPSYLAIMGFYPQVGAMDGDMTYQVVCAVPEDKMTSITFHANGGSETAAMNRPIGAVLGSLPTPERTGYTFGGWYTDDGSFEKPVDANTVVPEGGMTLYAKWTAVKVTVTLNPNDGILTDNTRELAYGSTYGELPEPERSGYGFMGWFTEQNGGELVTADTVMNKTEKHTLYAHWVELKVIPASVFDFGTAETVTYDKAAHKATYTFTAESGESYTEDSFKVSYVRVQDEFMSANTDMGEAATTAGKYNVTITREADGTYAKFDQTYNDVLVINRATRDLSGITNDDIEVRETGLTYVKVSLKDGAVPDLDENVNITYKVQFTDFYYWTATYEPKTYGTENQYKIENGYLYDLSPEIKYTITNVGIIGDINYEDVWSQKLNVPVQTKDADKDSWSKYADTSWYDANTTEFVITTPEQLAGFAALVGKSDDNFKGKTIRLGANIDLSAHRWATPIGYLQHRSSGNKHWAEWHILTDAIFDGGGYTISGMRGGGNNTDIGSIGLFGVIRGTTIQNLTLKDSYVSEDSSDFKPGGIVAIISDKGSTLKDCYSEAFVYRRIEEDNPYSPVHRYYDADYETYEVGSGFVYPNKYNTISIPAEADILPSPTVTKGWN